MTKFVVDAGVVLHLVSTGIKVSSRHSLLSPTLLRSQALSLLHEAVHRGDIRTDVARERLASIGRMPIRLLWRCGAAAAGVGSGGGVRMGRDL